MNKLIKKVAQRITVDYCRLSIVENPDGFLTQQVVRNLLYQESGVEVVSGTNLQLRIHYELNYQEEQDKRFVYVCKALDSVLMDMKHNAYTTFFSISDIFPLFADKALLRKQSAQVLAELLHMVGINKVSMGECQNLVDGINNRLMAEKLSSASHLREKVQSIPLDWNHIAETSNAISEIIEESAKAGVYDDIQDAIRKVDESFQTWIDNSYFALQNSSPVLHAHCVNKILPHISAQHEPNDKVALLVVDGLALWQWHTLRRYLNKEKIQSEEKVTTSWLPSITMLSRQAIFRGSTPSQNYKQNPENEKHLWIEYWKSKGFNSFDMQYLSDADDFRINEGVKRLAYVTVKMDKKMHVCGDMKDLYSLTDNWCPRIIEKIKAMKDHGFTIYLTSDHGGTPATGWRTLTATEKVFLYTDGSRGERHLIYNDANELQKMVDTASSEMLLLQRDNWIAIRDNSAFHREGDNIITHGGTNLMEVVVPFIKI